MNLIPWKNKREEISGYAPFEIAISRFRDEMDNLFERFAGDPWWVMSAATRFGQGPRMDLAETDNEITIKAELPGVDAKNLDVNVTGSTLTIRGEKKQDREEKGRDYYYAERQYGGFHRAVQLPATVDPEKVNAEFKNGVLTIRLTKRPEARSKKITVKNA
ncbi:MAG: Hsp20/alpha crystallin family protein [Phycisphaerales bacterium]|nr:Hsp20/alpha crystallin family protein [Phycisphaerales bacterium]